MTRVRLWQIDCSNSESPAERESRVLLQLSEAARGVDLLVLPELWLPGAFNLAAIAETRAHDSLVNRLGVAAADAGIWLHAGSVSMGAADSSGHTYNTALVFNPEGKLVRTYRKRHLFGFAGGERTVVAAGDDLAVVETPLGLTGLATCYDLRFPEQFRALVDAGAEAFVICAGWPTERINHWSVLLQARAIENQALTIACNARGQCGEVVLGGRSMVIDATGQIVAEGGADDEFVDADVDPRITAQWRADFPVLQDRR